MLKISPIAALLPFAVMAGFSLSVLPLARAQEIKQETKSVRTLLVTGRGDLPIQTTKAQVQLGVEVEAKTAGEAQTAIARRVSTLVAKLQQLNIEKLQTTSITLNPKYEYVNNRQNQVGFIGQSSVSFRVLNERAGAVLDASVAAGANRIDQISFVADPEAIRVVRNASLQDAVKDAQDRADAVLNVLNLKALSIRTIQINSDLEPVMPLANNRAVFAAKDSAPSTPVIGGEQRVQTSITLEIAY